MASIIPSSSNDTSEDISAASEQNRKLFIGGLTHNTTDEILK